MIAELVVYGYFAIEDGIVVDDIANDWISNRA